MNQVLRRVCGGGNAGSDDGEQSGVVSGEGVEVSETTHPIILASRNIRLEAN